METLIFRDIDTRHVERAYEKLLEQLKSGDFRSAEVKKLKNAGIYRAKLDDKNRLLFQLAEHGGRRYLLVLEVVRNHDYAKARFLNGGSWTESDFDPVPMPPSPDVPGEVLRYVNPGSATIHVLDKALSFDDAQTAVFDTPLPLIVIGSAGSGKTALTLEKLKTLPGRGLYLTRSAYLVESARSLYFANGFGNDGQEVDFFSLVELIQTIEVPKGREATFSDFALWYERVRGAFKLSEPHRIFEEIKGVIGGSATRGAWMEEEEYQALGVRQSIFLGEQRSVVHRIFKAWLAHMAESGLFDSNLVAWERCSKASPEYDFLVIDEVQDITNAELRLAIATLKDHRQFLLCGDSNQIVHPNLFSWARVRGFFFTNAEAPSSLEQIHILTANYRNTREVTALANRLLLMKQRRFGSVDRESNFLVECVSGEEGRVEIHPDDVEVRTDLDEKTHRSTRYAIIVLRDEDKAFARAAFRSPLVFSVQEAKGLEYENVILFNLVSSAPREFAECVGGVEAEDLETGPTFSRAKDKTDKSLDAYKFYVNSLYVAITRAVRTLIVLERDPRHPLWALLAVHRSTDQLTLAAEESSREDWQREARRLELQGKTEQAEQIRREILETGPVPWTVIDSATHAAIKARALEARDKEAQQLLFEYAVTCDARGLLPALVDAGFRHAKKAESGRAFIEETLYAPYLVKNTKELNQQIARYGIDFRNPLNETPLMVAARVGRAALVKELLAQGADPELTDSAGRNPLRVLLSSLFLGHKGKPSAFEEAWQALATQPLKVKIGSRMLKLDPRSMEWFLLHAWLVLYRGLAAIALPGHALPAIKASALSHHLGRLPERILPERRKQRAYVSSVLVKNESSANTPYNRRLFLRVDHAYYILNPVMESEVSGRFVPLDELMAMPLLIADLPPSADRDYFESWLSRMRAAAARDAATFEGAGTSPLPLSRSRGVARSPGEWFESGDEPPAAKRTRPDGRLQATDASRRSKAEMLARLAGLHDPESLRDDWLSSFAPRRPLKRGQG
jgi:hypothetical protein